VFVLTTFVVAVLYSNMKYGKFVSFVLTCVYLQFTSMYVTMF